MAQDSDVRDLVADLAALGHSCSPLQALGTQQAFDWVADCLLWLCQRAAPDISLPRDCSSEAKRVAFLCSLGSQLFARTRIRLRLRRLYRAGAGAVGELRRLAAALTEAAAAPPAVPLRQLTPAPRAEDRAQLRQLSQGIAASGAQLVNALEAAPGAAAGASAALAATADVAALQRQLQAGLATARTQAGQLEQSVAALGQEVQVLEARVEKRHVELDRLERRLDSLQAVKPAFSSEVEALEAELAGLFQQHLHRFRNLEWLEGALDAHAAGQQAKADEADRQLRRIQRQVAADGLRLLQGDQEGGPEAQQEPTDGLDSDDSEAGLGGWAGDALPRLGGGGAAGGAAAKPAGGGGGAAKAAAALELQLLGEDSGGGGRDGLPGKPGASRLGSTGCAGSEGGEGGGRGVTSGSHSLIPAHRAGSAGGRRATGSANSLLHGGGGEGEGGSANVLRVGSPMRHGSPADNDF